MAFRNPFFADIESYPSAAEVITSGGVNYRDRFTDRDTEHWSVYGLVEWDVSDQFKATIEGRYVEEEIEVTGFVCDGVRTQRLTGIAAVGGECDPFF